MGRLMPAKFKVKVANAAWLKTIRDKEHPVAAAAVAALRETASEAVDDGRKDIAAAGPGFRHAQWVSGLRFRMLGATKDGEPSLDAKAIISHQYGIAGVFEYGATIHGKPLLWIPTKHGAPTPGKSGKTLVSATVRGQPMLFDASDHDPHRKPLYIGVRSVTIPKKFHITQIAEQHAAQIEQAFIKNFKDEI
jgi:hypothetical protein